MQSYSSDYSSQGATIIAAVAKVMLNPKVAIPLATTIFSLGTGIGYAWHQGKKEVSAILTSNPERRQFSYGSHMFLSFWRTLQNYEKRSKNSL